MIRRPLDPFYRDENALIMPFAPLRSLFHKYGILEKEHTQILNPLFIFQDFNDVFARLGFLNGRPIDNIRNKRWAFHPFVNAGDDHPTFFLQWGARCVTQNHVIFEMGNYQNVIRFDFRHNKQGNIQLDEAHIWAGDEVLAVNCEDEFYRGFVSNLLNIVEDSVISLNALEIKKAKITFREISDSFAQLYRWQKKIEPKSRLKI